MKTSQLLFVMFGTITAYVNAKFDVCCDSVDLAPEANSLQLIDDMLNSRLPGRHFWWQNGDAIIETDGTAEYADSFPLKLKAIRDTCVKGYGQVAGHTCDHDPTQSNIQLYHGPQHGWKSGCIDLHFNQNKCLHHT